MGNKAVLQIGDAPGRLMRVGETEQGVKLLAASSEAATVLVNGEKKRLTLSIGTPLQPSVVSSQLIKPYLPPDEAPAAPQGQLTVQADASGHFHIPGQVNGKGLSFVVDTGASLVVLTEAQAKLAGYKLDDGRPVNSATANGTALSYLINLPSLKLGNLRFTNVQALIAPTFEGPEALLGMNVLRQVRMQQQGNQLTLSALPAKPKSKTAADTEP